MNRRSFVATALRASSASLHAPLARALAPALRASSASLHAPLARALAPAPSPILDAHVHLFDPTRPGGVPWPEPSDPIHRPALPDRLQAIAAPLGVVGAIAIEASPLPSDNDWLLHVVRKNPFMVGMIGDLVPGSPAFRPDLDRLHRSPLFLGIRYGNLWHRDLTADLANARTRPGFLDDLRALAQAGLTLESANPTPTLLNALLDLAQHLPNLRIVIDHLPHMQVPVDPVARRLCLATLQQLAHSPHIFIKLSEIPTPNPGQTQTSSQPHLSQLDPLWQLFGPDRVLFGSDWPNSDHVASYAETLAVTRDFVLRHAPSSTPDVFFATSQRAFRWKPRRPNQHMRA